MKMDALRISLHIASMQPMARAVLYLILVSLTSAHILFCEHKQIFFLWILEVQLWGQLKISN